MSAFDSDVPLGLRSEFNKLRSTYHYSEISIGREKDVIFIEYFTSFKRNKIKLYFSFNMNNLASIDLSIKNISSKDKHNINAAAVDFMMSIITDTFMEQIDDKPIYKSIECWDREFALKTTSTVSSQPSTQRSNNTARPSPQTQLQQRVLKRAKAHQKKQLKVKDRKKMEKEYIVFLRFNQLFQGTQHKKEVQILEELTHLRSTSDDLWAYVLYGTPGIICVGSTASVIKGFVRKCNEIGRKPVIAYNRDMKGMRLSRIQEQKDDKHHNALLYLLELLHFKDKLKTLNAVLTGTVTRNHHHKKKKKESKETYIEGAKYEFHVDIAMSYSYNYHTRKNNAPFYVTIYGQNDNKLVSNHRFHVKQWYQPS
eukprot:25391_1